MITRLLRMISDRMSFPRIEPKYDLGYRIVDRLPDRPPFPNCISINVHNYCNARCNMCPIPNHNKSNKRDVMDFALFKRIVDDYCSLGGGTLTFCQNGELFAHRSSLSYIEYAVSKRAFDIYFVTNVSQLTPAKTDALIGMGFDGKVYISFHGIRKRTYERTMGLNYRMSLKNANYVIKNLKNVQFIRSLTHNMEPGEKEETERYWNRRGVAVSFDTTHSWGGTTNEEIEMHSIVKGCIQPLNQLCIDTNGDVYLCCIDILKQVVVGNIQDASIEEIWNGEQYLSIIAQIFNNDVPASFLCRKCHAAITP